MELKIVDETKNKIVFEIKGEGNSFCNALVKELWSDEHVKAAAYNIDHPLVGVPRVILETDGADPRKTLSDAAKRLKKINEDFRKKFLSAIK